MEYFIIVAIVIFIYIVITSYNETENTTEASDIAQKDFDKFSSAYNHDTKQTRKVSKSLGKIGNDEYVLNIEYSYDDEKQEKKQKQYDNFEGWFYDEVSDYINIKKKLSIKYKDGQGQVTKRDIDVYKFGRTSYGGFILAVCNLRNANRSFRTDRILECIDLETGEFIKDVASFLENEYLKTDEYKNIQIKQQKQEEKAKEVKYYNDFWDKYNTLLKIIVYMVKCDGTYNKREKAIVREVFEYLENNNELITDKFLNKVVKNIKMPTERGFKVNVTKFIKENKFDIDIVELAKNIISTQNTIHPREQEMIKFLNKKFETDIKIEYIPENTNNGIECPNCHSNNTRKRGLRKASNHINQRYSCQSCNKIFSIKINDKDESKQDEQE